MPPPLNPDPIAELGAWIDEARAEGIPQPASVAFITASVNGRPAARTVTLKRLEPDALVFTSALWTRKAREIESNPHVALLFHWPQLGRQAHLTGLATQAERALAEDLFAARDELHQLQTIVSRQGEPIEADELAQLRNRLAHLATVPDPAPLPRRLGRLPRHPRDDRALERSPRPPPRPPPLPTHRVRLGPAAPRPLSGRATRSPQRVSGAS